MPVQENSPGVAGATPVSDQSAVLSEKHFGLPSKKILVLFLLFILILALGLALFFYLSFKQKVVRSPINFEEVNYPSLLWKNRVLKNADVAKKEKDNNKRFELYEQIFTDLAAIYGRDHAAKTRHQVEEFKNFLSKEFPKLYDPKKFFIPCLDTGCATVYYPLEIETLKTELRNVTVFEPAVLSSVMKKFEAAALSSEKNYQWQNYLGALQEILSETRRTKDEKIKQIAITFRDFLKKNYPENYTGLEKVIPEAVQL